MSSILVVGRSANVMQSALAVLRDGGFDPEPALDWNEAAATLREGSFDAVVIGSGVQSEGQEKLHEVARERNVPVVDHDGPFDVLNAEVRTALGDGSSGA